MNEPTKLRRELAHTLQKAIVNGGKEIETALETLTEKLTALVRDVNELAKEMKIVESLLFPMISERQQRIIEANSRTHDWFFEEISTSKHPKD